MLFQVNVKNLGKIKDADIRIGNFTVFAGRNSTGKSYASKALYSFLSAMNANHVDVVLNQRLYRRLSRLSRVRRTRFPTRRGAVPESMNNAMRDLRKVVRQIVVREDVDEFDAIGEVLPKVHELLDVVEQDFWTIKKDVDRFLKRNSAKAKNIEGDASYMLDHQLERENAMLEELASEFKHVKSLKPENWVSEGIEHEIRENFLQNFQVTQLSYLHGADDESVQFNVPRMGGGISIEDENISWNADKGGLHLMQKCPKVLYLESPIFWRLKNVLDNIKYQFPMVRGQAPVTGVPKYYHDMSAMLDVAYTGEPVCPEVAEKLTGDKVLGGKVVVGDTDMFFQSNKGAKYPLCLAATGIANLGVLALLIERNHLTEDSFLFIDEPEAHLHPAWQVEMADALFELSKKGINVVIATHSADIIKWVEVQMKKESEQKEGAENHFVLNHFVEGDVEHQGDVFTQIENIKDDLREPYQDLFIENLRT